MRVADIPGYLDAVIRERFVRDVSILRINESISGFDLAPFTLRHFTILKIANSPFLPPFTDPSESDVIEFLWLLNPAYTPSQKHLRRFMKRCKPFRIPKMPWILSLGAFKRWQERKNMALDNFAVMVKALQDFMSETFQDKPASIESLIPQPSYYSDVVSVMGVLSREWHISPTEALQLPIKLIFQILNENRDVAYARAGQTATLCNPSDKLKTNWVKERNGRN